MKLMRGLFIGLIFFLGLSPSVEGQMNPLYSSLMTAFNRELAYIYSLPQYQVEITLKDENTGQWISQMLLEVDETQGKAAFNIHYYSGAIKRSETTDFDNFLGFHLWAFQDSQRIFSQSSQPAEISERVSLVEKFTPDPFSIFLLKDRFFFVPNNNELGEFRPWQVNRNENAMTIHAQRIQIPERIFESLALGKIVFKQNISNQDIFKIDSSLEFKSSNSLGITWEQVYPATNNVSNQLKANFDSQETIQKLTDLKLLIKPDQHLFEAELTGLVQNFELNLFNKDTAKFDTTNYLMFIRIQPLLEEILDEEILLQKSSGL